MPLITIDDSTPIELHSHVGPDGLLRAKGCIPRDWDKHPQGCLAAASAFDLPIIPEADWDALIAEQEAQQSSLQHIRNKGGPNGGMIPSRDQNGKGYCWAHSTTSATLLGRAAPGEMYVDLSAYAIACIIKGYRDEGGNGIDSVQFMADRGIPTSQFWPQQSMSRANDNPQTWANAALHKMLVWRDCSQDRATRRLQVGTALLLNLPVIGDYDWWSHSVCPCRLMSRSKVRIWNSWGDSWSDSGMGDLDQSKAWPDAAWVAVLEMPSVN